jgi:hypothetical protein
VSARRRHRSAARRAARATYEVTALGLRSPRPRPTSTGAQVLLRWESPSRLARVGPADRRGRLLLRRQRPDGDLHQGRRSSSAQCARQLGDYAEVLGGASPPWFKYQALAFGTRDPARSGTRRHAADAPGWCSTTAWSATRSTTQRRG